MLADTGSCRIQQNLQLVKASITEDRSYCSEAGDRNIVMANLEIQRRRALLLAFSVAETHNEHDEGSPEAKASYPVYHCGSMGSKRRSLSCMCR